MFRVRHEAMWGCRGVAPLVLNLGTGGEGVSDQVYASTAVHPAREPGFVVGPTAHGDERTEGIQGCLLYSAL
jgi:hypothetical protein